MDNMILIGGTIVAICIAIGFIFSKVSNSDREQDIFRLFVSSGIGLILTSFATTSDKVLDIVNALVGHNMNTSENNYISIFCGFLLIGVGIYYRRNIRDRFFVFNFISRAKKVISDVNSVKDLKLSDFKLREQIVDVVRMFDDGKSMTKTSCKFITGEIEEKSNCFINQSKDFKKAFTGMGAIPFTILMGSYLSEVEIDDYFEYKHSDGKYYVLKNKKWYQKSNDFQRFVDNGAMQLRTCSEVVIAISVTREVIDTDLEQFRGVHIIKMKVDNPKDNIIITREQLNYYANEIIEKMESLKTTCIGVQKIHLVGAIPSCLSIEIGRRISLKSNRIPQVVSYHYIANNTPKYGWGIVVTNIDKGKFIKV